MPNKPMPGGAEQKASRPQPEAEGSQKEPRPAFKDILDRSLVWLVLAMLVSGALGAFKIQELSKRWAKEVAESNEYRELVEGWAKKEATSVMNASDQEKIRGLIDQIVENQSLRDDLIDKLRTDPAFTRELANAMKNDPTVMAGLISNIEGQLPSILREDPALVELLRGPRGPRGPSGTMEISTENLRWTITHAAAGAACAATSPEGGSPWSRLAVPRREGRACADTCKYETGGEYTNCSTSVAIGSISTQKASSYNEVVARHYRYSCGDTQAAYDEIKGGASVATYAAYCCCFR